MFQIPCLPNGPDADIPKIYQHSCLMSSAGVCSILDNNGRTDTVIPSTLYMSNKFYCHFWSYVKI